MFFSDPGYHRDFFLVKSQEDPDFIQIFLGKKVYLIWVDTFPYISLNQNAIALMGRVGCGFQGCTGGPDFSGVDFLSQNG